MARELETLHELASTAKWLADEDIPASVWIDTDAGQQNSAHWSATLILMREILGRRLTHREVAVLSLSRGFGPVPRVSADLVRVIYDKIFPHGNNHGGYYPWRTMYELLSELAEA